MFSFYEPSRSGATAAATPHTAETQEDELYMEAAFQAQTSEDIRTFKTSQLAIYGNFLAKYNWIGYLEI